MMQKIISESISFIFVALFLYTGIDKLLDIEGFKIGIEATVLLKPISLLLSWCIPIAEIVISLMLLFDRARIQAFYITSFLMLSFVAYVGLILSQDKELPCTCGGIIGQLSWSQHMLVNTILLILSLIGIINERNKRSKQYTSKMNKLSQHLN